MIVRSRWDNGTLTLYTIRFMDQGLRRILVKFILQSRFSVANRLLGGRVRY